MCVQRLATHTMSAKWAALILLLIFENGGAVFPYYGTLGPTDANATNATAMALVTEAPATPAPTISPTMTSDDFEGGYSTYLGRDSSRDSLKFVETEAVTEHVRASCEAKGKSSAVCSRATHMAGPMLWCMASKHPYAVCAKQAIGRCVSKCITTVVGISGIDLIRADSATCQATCDAAAGCIPESTPKLLSATHQAATSSLAGGTPSGAAHIGPGFASTLDQDSVHSEPGLGSTSGEAEGPRAVWESGQLAHIRARIVRTHAAVSDGFVRMASVLGELFGFGNSERL